jgi:hypothetical protein
MRLVPYRNESPRPSSKGQRRGRDSCDGGMRILGEDSIGLDIPNAPPDTNLKTYEKQRIYKSVYRL